MKGKWLRLLPAILLAFGWTTPGTQAGEKKKPNILVIYADDLGYGELGCYGNKQIPTPNIDKLAAAGVRCTQGYVSAPLCSPSRAGLMTGRYQTRFGHENNAMAPGKGLPLQEVTLANRLKTIGYATSIVGKWHLGGQVTFLPVKRGFDEYYGVIGNPGSYFTPGGFIDSKVSLNVQEIKDKDFYTTDAFGARAAAWIDAHKKEPWFLYLPFNAVHSPHDATEKYLKRFAHIPDKKQRQFAALLSGMDDAVGVVMAKLKELNLEEDTLIFFISDNGAPTPRQGNGVLHGGKYTMWEGGVRLPYMVIWKGKLPANKTYDFPVIQLDVMPTCIAAAGGKVDPAWKLDGVDLLPYLRGDNAKRPHETLYWRIDGMWAIRHGDMKLCHPVADKAPPMLFDLSSDVGETKDLAQARPEEVRALQGLWDRWNDEQKDGVIPKKKKNKK
jgi:arylsulfatase A-like enzyme